MYMRSPLDQIEITIKSLFEGNLSVFSWMDEQSLLMHRLIEAIHECLVDHKDDFIELPMNFAIYLNPLDRQFLEAQEEWETAVAKIISELAEELNLQLEKKPGIQIFTRNSLGRTEVQVKVHPASAVSGRTNAVRALPPASTHKDEIHSCTASLILEDESLFPLENPVINIGRKSNNHLVINDLRVSRTHAQIRFVSKGYIIFDIGSSGGTYINGERVNQRKLKPGDVISLGGIKLIYTEDQTSLIERPHEITSEIKTLHNSGDHS